MPRLGSAASLQRMDHRAGERGRLVPVIERELRAAARHAATWRLRLAFATGAVLACGLGWVWPHVSQNERGQIMLICLAVSGFILSLFAGIYLAADSVSSEKREGTLGLLFLTPLRGWQIVVGKTVSQSLQVGCAWLAIFPVFFLPVLHGGVTGAEVARLLLALLLTLLLSLACGMFWSTVCTEAKNSVMASVTTILGLCFLPWLPTLLRHLLRMGSPLDVFTMGSPITLIAHAFHMNYRWAGRPLPASGAVLYWATALHLLLLAIALVGVSGWLLPRLWRRAESGDRPTRPVPARNQPGTDRLSLKRRWARSSPASPIGWVLARGLQEVRWQRWLRWILLGFFLVMLGVSVATKNWEEGFITAFLTAYGLHFLTRIQFAMAATRQLHEDHRSGALELLLVAPVPDSHLVQAHHEALRHEFRHAYRALLALNVALQAMVLLFPRQLHMNHGVWAIFSVFFVGGALLTVADFQAMRWLALREALRNATHLKSAGKVLAFLVAFSWPAFAAVFLLSLQAEPSETTVACIFLTWFLACAVYDAILVRRCRAWLKPGLRWRAAESR